MFDTKTPIIDKYFSTIDNSRIIYQNSELEILSKYIILFLVAIYELSSKLILYL